MEKSSGNKKENMMGMNWTEEDKVYWEKRKNDVGGDLSFCEYLEKNLIFKNKKEGKITLFYPEGMVKAVIDKINTLGSPIEVSEVKEIMKEDVENLVTKKGFIIKYRRKIVE